ncbi:hypothetical protein ACFSC4_27820 [Deinococcus malanensis]
MGEVRGAGARHTALRFHLMQGDVQGVAGVVVFDEDHETVVGEDQLGAIVVRQGRHVFTVRGRWVGAQGVGREAA